ncbi:odorant receptor 33a [Drosophila ficusphila]|uniref:odorant receptor 33a n=1 Tax=Drosophila ficusphila TaxID=30025 RepID=UPI0007E79434|nr:odorant receptor 33a [Drosophila ficusphila]
MESKLPVVRSESLYKIYWLYLRILAVEGNYPYRWILDFIVFFFITFWYPVHLIIGLYNEPVVKVFRSLYFTIEVFFCSFKFVFFRWNMAEIKVTQNLLLELDKRAESDEERSYFEENSKPVANLITKGYLVAGLLSIVTAAAAGFVTTGRNLMYLGWFPYDVKATALYFWISFTYQFVGSTLSIVQNLSNDIYPPITFCVVTGHVRLLAMRLSRIGKDGKKSSADNTRELIKGIEDHRKLMQIIRLLRKTLYFTQLGQFLSTGINISISLVNILFLAENNYSMIYYSVFFAAMFIELFPSCYYGTLMSMEFDKLPYAIFSSNWSGMDRKYCRSLIILMGFMLIPVDIKAAGIVGIDMRAFFSTVRMAYSFFTLAMSFRF